MSPDMDRHAHDMIAETAKRTARMETRLMSLASALGVDLQNGQKLTTTLATTGVQVHLNGLDVSISRIRNYLATEFPGRHGEAPVYRDGELVATVIY